MRTAHVFSIVSLGLLMGCSHPAISDLGTSVLASTSYVSADQAKGLLSAGDKLIKSQEELTPEQEYYLGRAVSAQVLERYPPAFASSKTTYINSVGQIVAGVSEMPETFGGYHFAVITSDEINAVSAPGGFIFVSSALLQQISNEDELAAVLAHEVAHVVKRHGVAAISNANLFSALTEASRHAASVAASQAPTPVDLGSITGVFAESVSGITEKLLTKGYDRSQEYEADLYAATLLQRAGYDPKALVRVLTLLEGTSVNKRGGWFDTHPSPADRIEELEDDFSFPQEGTANSARVKRFQKVMG